MALCYAARRAYVAYRKAWRLYRVADEQHLATTRELGRDYDDAVDAWQKAEGALRAFVQEDA